MRLIKCSHRHDQRGSAVHLKKTCNAVDSSHSERQPADISNANTQVADTRCFTRQPNNAIEPGLTSAIQTLAILDVVN